MLLAATSGCIPFASVDTTPGVQGVVLAADDGLPVSNAYVTVPDFELSATTDAEGRFTIEPESERRWLVMVLPGSSAVEFAVQAWHGDGAHGEAHTRVTSIISSFGHSSRELLILLVPSDAPVHPVFDGCESALSLQELYAAQLAVRMEALVDVEAFRAAYDREAAWHFEDSLQQGLHRAAESCGIERAELGPLLDASSRRRSTAPADT